MGIQERKQREKEQRREAIIDCALKVFVCKGYAAATMDEIAECAEFSKATLYLYVKNKDELGYHVMLKVITTFINKIREKMDSVATSEEKLEMVGVAYLELYQQYPGYYKLLNSLDNHDAPIMEDCQVRYDLAMASQNLWAIIGEPIVDLVRRGILKPETNPIELGIMLWGASTGLIDILDHVTNTHKAEDPELLDEEIVYLKQIAALDFHAMLHKLWDGIINQYLL